MWKGKNTFLLGLGIVGLGFLLRKPAHALLVKTVQGVLGVGEQIQEIYYNAKEEIEDIVAEAHYEHMKSKVNSSVTNEEEPS